MVQYLKKVFFKNVCVVTYILTGKAVVDVYKNEKRELGPIN